MSSTYLLFIFIINKIKNLCNDEICNAYIKIRTYEHSKLNFFEENNSLRVSLSLFLLLMFIHKGIKKYFKMLFSLNILNISKKDVPTFSLTFIHDFPV